MTSYPLTPDLPLMNQTINDKTRPVYLKELKELQAHRLWIAPDRPLLFSAADGQAAVCQEREEALRQLKENMAYFQGNGLEVGIWIQAFGFGDPLTGQNPGWTPLTSVTGHAMANRDAFCPEDPSFCSAYLAHIKEMAALQPDLLMLDDDLCMSVRPGIGCFCSRHMKLLEEALGEPLEPDRMPELLFCGGPNRYRDAWYQVMGDTLRRFCRKVRQAADEVDPGLRVGFCSGYTSWDFEGADAVELAEILAGKNEPFLRFTGAPYWCSRLINRFPAQKQNAVIECARQQNVWCKNSGVEVFAEADSYPRPSYHVNASYIENFDLAMRAEGVRSLKYMLDYFSTPEYEKQYIKIHKRNIPLYERIGQTFADKKAAGVRLFCPMHRIKDAWLPTAFAGEGELMRLFFSQSAAMLTGVGIPVCYEGMSGCAAAFGEDVLAADDLTKYPKMILDLPAARLLAQNGVDVGLLSAEKTSVPVTEYFPGNTDGEWERLLLSGVGWGAPFEKTGGFYEVQIKENAIPQSYFASSGKKWISSYRYHNGVTEFLVFSFDALAAGESSSIFASYCRQKQLMDFVGNDYPAIRGFAEIYSLCAVDESGKKYAVLFENLSIDPVFDFEIELGSVCSSFTLYGAEGVLSEDGKKIQVRGDFAPSSAILLEVCYR